MCGNVDLYYEVGGYAGTVYHCKDCGYIGAFIVEANEEMIEKIREKYKRERQNDSKDSDESNDIEAMEP